MQNETTPVSEEHDSSTEEPVTATSNVDAPGVEALRRSDRLISSSSLLEDVVIDSDDSTEFIDRTYAPSKQKKRGRRNTDSEDERLDFELLADAATEIAEATNADRQPQTAASASPGAPSSTLDINGANAASENHSTPTQLNVRKRAKQITEDEPLAPAPCDLIAKGCITNGSPFLRSHIQNGKLMHMMRDGSSAPLSKIDGSKHLTACPIQNDSAQVRKLARNSVELVCKYVVGDLDFYPPMNPGRTETNLISRQQQDWLEDHKTELLASRRVPSQVQLIADKFSTEMGIERFHAAIFWDRFKGDGIFEGVTTKIRGKKLSEAEYKVAYSAVLATFDLLREWPDYLHPDLKFSVQEMRLAEWVSLICVAITDEFDCIIRPKNLLERLREALIALKPKLDPKVVEILADWRRKPNTEFHKKERGAGGCRPKIGGIAFDLITLDCFPQPAPGGITATTSKISVDQASNKTTTITSTHSVKVSEYLSQPGWQPFIPPQHEVHKVEDPSSPNKIAIASSVLQAGDKFVAANCILLQGKRLNVSPLAPIHANFDFVNAMTPRSPLASTIFQQVYVLSALFRDDSKGNVEVAFVFPEPAHTYVALSTQPVWQSGLAMADVRKLDFAETEGIRNPLSVLKGACRTVNCNASYIMQRGFGSAMLPAAPYSALLIADTDEHRFFRLTYFSPVDAAFMIGHRVPFFANIAEGYPYPNAAMSQPLTPLHTPHFPPHCTECGAIGHESDACTHAQHDTGTGKGKVLACKACQKAGTSETCNVSPCKILREYKLNSDAMVKAVIEDKAKTFIYSAAATVLREQLYRYS
ncbi:uncharacterized protein SPSC_04067 [Sporisorium scitamineum]|uniref:Uncharacterized protein n=1 Tax=Sporisorium scitamineum TaxID=49012 RepID=A0A127ZET7_9BASI|nr:uncharacterized protein SPSC_04067 [Sporisorium scitamineum]